MRRLLIDAYYTVIAWLGECSPWYAVAVVYGVTGIVVVSKIIQSK